MFAYIVRRLLWAVLLLIVLSMVTFSIFYLIPRLGGATPETLATRYVGRAATAETVHLTAERLGFFDPVPVQYWNWLKGVLVGAEYDYGAGVEHCPAPCLGYSFITKQPVWPELLDRAPVTISLTVGAVDHLAGRWCHHWRDLSAATRHGVRPGSYGHRAGRGVATDLLHRADRAGILQLPARDHRARRLITFRSVRTRRSGRTRCCCPGSRSPSLFSAQYARLTRAGMLETMTEDYIRTARAKGLSERKVVVKHALRGALTPVLTIFGLDVGLLLGGAVITEQTFSLNGLGKYALDGIRNNDLPKVLGVTLVAGFFVIMANLFVDLLYGVIDPRVRLE